jgi:hypothetical protein
MKPANKFLKGLLLILLPEFSYKYPVTNAATINPAIYPTVGPARAIAPFLNPLKTGSPIRPIKTYIVWLARAHLLPRNIPESSTVKTCMVIGTGVKGRYTNEFADIAIRTAKIKENTRLVVILLS